MKNQLSKDKVNRLCIFSFYDRNGYVDRYISWLFLALDSFVSEWIVVVNGKVDRRGEEIFRKFTNHIYVRENTGFDAGAYKCIICDCLGSKKLRKYEEIILCNNTFFFLSNSFGDIFQYAHKCSWDFWGITGYLKTIFSHIQSYFLVFSKKILEQDLLIEYFSKYIDGKTNEIGVVCAQFEMGLFDFLAERSCIRYGCLVDLNDLDVYCDSFRCLKRYNIPIVKKKTFSRGHNLCNMLMTLDFVRENTKFPIEFIIECILRIYHRSILDEDFSKSENLVPPKIGMSMPICSENDIEEFLKVGEYYIYGAGIYACKAYWKYVRKISGFKGFVVSNSSAECPKVLFGYPVYFLEQIKSIHAKRILIAVKTAYADEIMEQFSLCERKNVLRIF